MFKTTAYKIVAAIKGDPPQSNSSDPSVHSSFPLQIKEMSTQVPSPHVCSSKPHEAVHINHGQNEKYKTIIKKPSQTKQRTFRRAKRDMQEILKLF